MGVVFACIRHIMSFPLGDEESHIQTLSSIHGSIYVRIIHVVGSFKDLINDTLIMNLYFWDFAFNKVFSYPHNIR